MTREGALRDGLIFIHDEIDIIVASQRRKRTCQRSSVFKSLLVVVGVENINDYVAIGIEQMMNIAVDFDTLRVDTVGYG